VPSEDARVLPPSSYSPGIAGETRSVKDAYAERDLDSRGCPVGRRTGSLGGAGGDTLRFAHEQHSNPSLGDWCQTPVSKSFRIGLANRAFESRSKPLQPTSATDLIPENADFAAAQRDLTKNTSLLGQVMDR
jgi:hypothetical protein